MDINTVYSGIAGMVIGCAAGRFIWKSAMEKGMADLLTACKIIRRTYLNEGYDCAPSNSNRIEDYEKLKTIRESIKRKDPKLYLGEINATRYSLIAKIEGSFPEGRSLELSEEFNKHRDAMKEKENKE